MTTLPMRSKPVPLPTLLDDGMGTAPQRAAVSTIDPDKIAKNLKSNGFVAFNGKGQNIRRDFKQLHRDMKLPLCKKSEWFTELLDITPQTPQDPLQPPLPDILYSTQANTILAEVLMKLVERNSVPYTLIEKICANDQDGRRALLVLDRKYLPIHTVDMQVMRKNLLLKVTGKGDPCVTLRAVIEAGDTLQEAENYSPSSLVGDLIETIAENPAYMIVHRELTADRQVGVVFDPEYVVDKIQTEWDTYIKPKRVQPVAFAAAAEVIPEAAKVTDNADRITTMMEQLTAMQETTMAVMTAGYGKGYRRDKGQKGKGGKGKGGKGGTKGGPRPAAKFPCSVCKAIGKHAVHYISDCPVVHAGATSMNVTLQGSGSREEPNAAGACEPCDDEDPDSGSEDEMFGICVPTDDEDGDDVPELVYDYDVTDSSDEEQTGYSDEEDSVGEIEQDTHSVSPDVWTPEDVQLSEEHQRTMLDTVAAVWSRITRRRTVSPVPLIPTMLRGTRTTYNVTCDCVPGEACPPRRPFELCPNNGRRMSGAATVDMLVEQAEPECVCPELCTARRHEPEAPVTPDDEDRGIDIAVMLPEVEPTSGTADDVFGRWWTLLAVMYLVLGLVTNLLANASTRLARAPDQGVELMGSMRNMVQHDLNDVMLPVHPIPAIPNMTWLVDSGAGYHLCRNLDWFSEINTGAPVQSFRVAHAKRLETKGVGTVPFPVKDIRGQVVVVNLTGVYYAPDQPFNLLSVGCLMDSGFDSPDFRGCTIHKEGRKYVMSRCKNVYHWIGASLDEIQHPNVFTPAAPVDQSQVVERDTKQDPDTRAPRDTTVWQWVRSEYRKYAAMLTGGRFDVDLFSSNGAVLGDSQEPEGMTVGQDCFTANWWGKYFYGMPPFENAVINRVLNKAVTDFEYAPQETVHMFLVPVNVTASWWPLTRYFTEVHRYAPGSVIFSVPSELAVEQRGVSDAGEEGGAGRVLIEGCPFEVVILYRDATTPIRTDDYVKAHLRLGHYGPKHICKLLEQGVNIGLNLKQKHLLTEAGKCHCRACVLAKMKRPVKQPKHDLEKLYGELKPYEFTVSDITGPIDPPAPDGSRYLIHFTCIRTRYTDMYTMVYKSEAGYYLQKFLVIVRSRGFELKGMVLKTDNDSVYTGEDTDFAKICKQEGIRQKFVDTLMHEQAAFAEAIWRVRSGTARALLLTSGLGKDKWVWAYRHANFIANRMPHSNNKWQIPFNMVFRKQYDMSLIRVFGCKAFFWKDGEKRKKLDDKAVEGMYVGQSEDGGAYCVYDIAADKIRKVGKPVFFESFDSLGEKISDRSMVDHLLLELDDDIPQTPPKQFRPLLSPDTTENLVIVSHSAFYDTDDKETYAILELRVGNQKPALNIWTYLSSFLEDRSQGMTNDEQGPRKVQHWEVYMKYMRSKLCSGQINVYYPLFAQVLTSPGGGKKWHTGTIVSLDLNSEMVYGGCMMPSESNRADDWIGPADLKRAEVRFENPDSGDFNCTTDDGYIGVAVGEKMPASYSDPRSIKHAMTYPDWKDWEAAIQKEIDSIDCHGVLEYVEKVPWDADVLGCKLLLTTKTDKNGCKERCKGRLVCQGFGQNLGVSFEDTYAPTMHLECLRILMVLTLALTLTTKHLDVATAFLNSDIKYDVYVRLPEGYHKKYTHAKLVKSLYGLRQAAKDWFDTQDDFLMKFEPNLKKCTLEPCFYYLISDKVIFLVLVHVDDYVVAHNSDTYYAKFLKAFGKRFKINELGELDHILQMGVYWNKDRTEVSFSQKKHIEKVAAHYGLTNCKPKYIPMSTDKELKKGEPMDSTLPYLNLLGSLMWVARCTRPDVQFCVNYLAQFSHCYTMEHFTALKQVAKYLYTTRDLKFFLYKPQKPFQGEVDLVQWTDSDWATDKNDRKSITGHISFVLGQPVSWGSRKQKSVAHSSTEGELVAAVDTAKEGKYLSNLIGQLYKVKKPMTIKIDNQGAKFLCEGEGVSQRAKHIDLKFWALRDWVAEKIFKLIYVATDANIADMMTKALGQIKLDAFRYAAHVR